MRTNRYLKVYIVVSAYNIKMKTQLITFDRENPSDDIYPTLDKSEKEKLELFKKSVSGTSKSNDNIKTYMREMLRYKVTMEQSILTITIEDVDDYVRLVNNSPFSDAMKNKIKIVFKRYIRFLYKDWNTRFTEEDLSKLNGENDPHIEKKITEKDLLTKEEVKELIKFIPTYTQKTLIYLHSLTGARTGELVWGNEKKEDGRKCVPLTWDKINFTKCKGQNMVLITLTSIKNKKGTLKEREIPLIGDIVDYLKYLQEEQAANKKYTINSYEDKIIVMKFNLNKRKEGLQANYKRSEEKTLEEIERLKKRIVEIKSNNFVFTSKRNLRTCMTANYYRQFLHQFMVKRFGRSQSPGIFRKAKVTELDELVRIGKITKQDATEIMGHNEKMFDNIYSRLTKEKKAKILMEKMVDIDEMPEEEKHALEKKYDDLKASIPDMIKKAVDERMGIKTDIIETRAEIKILRKKKKE